MNSTGMRRILTVFLESQSGALARVVQMFAARGYTIDTLTVSPTEDKTLSRMTIVTHGDASAIEQITKQINKIIDVYRVSDITEMRHVERELMMVSLRADSGEMRAELMRIIGIFRSRIIDVSDRGYIAEVTGHSEKLDAFLVALPDKCIVETVRTGVSGLLRGTPGTKRSQ